MFNYNEIDDVYTYNEYICSVIYLQFLYFVKNLIITKDCQVCEQINKKPMNNIDIFEFLFAHIVYDNNVYKDFVTFCGEDNLKNLIIPYS